MSSTKKTYSIYVIELNPNVLKIKKFREKNPDYIEGKPCVYVGYTDKTPEERFAEHKAGMRKGPLRWHNTYAKNFGTRLKPRLFKYQNSQNMSQPEAKDMEIEKARRLRKRGYAIWQN
jgi:hypothetical protein